MGSWAHAPSHSQWGQSWPKGFITVIVPVKAMIPILRRNSCNERRTLSEMRRSSFKIWLRRTTLIPVASTKAWAWLTEYWLPSRTRPWARSVLVLGCFGVWLIRCSSGINGLSSLLLLCILFYNSKPSSTNRRGRNLVKNKSMSMPI